jgi:small subunit ribosomal protein S13
LDDTSKSKNEETPKPPVEDMKEGTAEEPQPEETSEEQVEGKSDNEEEKPSEQVEETDKEEKPTEEPSKVEEQPTEEAPKTEEEKPVEEQQTEEPEAKEDVKKELEQPEKPEPKKAEEKKKQHKDDFKYIVRLANTDINGEKTVVQGLTTIKGVGAHMSVLIIDETGINRKIKMGDLTDVQIEKIQTALGNITKNAPAWMLNHRKDYDTGKDIHLIGSEIDMRLRDEINIMKKIRSYRGIRHERGLCVRGQRTRANNRRGLALGVSKKSVQDKK